MVNDISKEEIFENLLVTENFRIERIVSKGHTSPKDFWYDQEQNEWVFVVKGHAILFFQDENQEIELQAGDYINIPARKKHQVKWTDPEQETVWLAIYY